MKLFTIAEAAELLSIPVATLRDWRVHRKHLAFVRLGGCLRIEAAEIERYIDAHRELPQERKKRRSTVAKTVATEQDGAPMCRHGRRAQVVDFTTGSTSVNKCQ